MNCTNIFYTSSRDEWRAWLADNFRTAKEIWFVFPTKAAHEPALPYNDAVEEALCFGWIDSTIKYISPNHRAQRFTPRREGSPYSRPNIERLIWLDSKGLIHPDIREGVAELITKPYTFPADIIALLQQDGVVWHNFTRYSEPYKRIRIAHIDAARKRPEEFQRRLGNFIKKCREGKMIVGYGGVDKYYNL